MRALLTVTKFMVIHYPVYATKFRRRAFPKILNGPPFALLKLIAQPKLPLDFLLQSILGKFNIFLINIRYG
jgi:hypothetical protein